MSISIEYPFTTPANYTYDTDKVDVAGGLGILKSLGTPTDFTEDFNDGTGLTFDSADIEIVGGANAALKLKDNTGQTFNEDFADDTDFTYDSDKSEFSGGKVQQKSQAPTDSTCWATYTTNINLNYGGGVLTGTGVGSPTITGNKLDLTGESNKYVKYDADLNADNQQTGCIRFKYTPDYSGAPASPKYIVTISKEGSDNNKVQLYHTSTLIFTIVTDSTGGSIISNADTWSPTSGVTYEFEFNYDITSGASRLFIDGVQLGVTFAGTGTRDSDIGQIVIGANRILNGNSDFYIEDLIIFDTVQHTANYTPGYSLPETHYEGDVITLPTMTYSGLGAIQAFTNIVATENNTPRYIMNGQYYSGGWTASSDTWATASPLATVLANIGTLSAADTMIIDVVTNDGSSQMDVDDLTLTYTGQIYATDNPTIDIDAALTATGTGKAVEAWNSFTDTVTETGSDLIKFVLSDDNGSTYKYWTGSAWSVSSGYAQSNTGAEINTNIGTFPKTTSGIKVKIYLHSDDGSTTPSIGNLVINYDDYIYPTDNPTIYPSATLTTDALETFSATVNESGSDTVTFTVSVNGVEYYWTGSAWATSSGYAQSNSAADVTTNISSLDVSDGKTVYFITYLHSADGSTTPSIDIMAITYDYFGPADTSPATCVVYGYLLTQDNEPVSGETITAYISSDSYIDSKNFFTTDDNVTTTTDADGYFELDLIRSVEYEETITYTIRRGTNKKIANRDILVEDVAIPDAETVKLNVLAGFKVKGDVVEALLQTIAEKLDDVKDSVTESKLENADKMNDLATQVKDSIHELDSKIDKTETTLTIQISNSLHDIDSKVEKVEGKTKDNKKSIGVVRWLIGVVLVLILGGYLKGFI